MVEKLIIDEKDLKVEVTLSQDNIQVFKFFSDSLIRKFENQVSNVNHENCVSHRTIATHSSVANQSRNENHRIFVNQGVFETQGENVNHQKNENHSIPVSYGKDENPLHNSEPLKSSNPISLCEPWLRCNPPSSCEPSTRCNPTILSEPSASCNPDEVCEPKPTYNKEKWEKVASIVKEGITPSKAYQMVFRGCVSQVYVMKFLKEKKLIPQNFVKVTLKYKEQITTGGEKIGNLGNIMPKKLEEEVICQKL